MEKIKEGKILKGVVTGVEPYGVFVKIDDFYSGLIHISEISTNFVRNPSDFVELDEIISVQVLEANDKTGQMKLSIKNIEHKSKIINKKKKIVETSIGFKTLEYKLPFWIEENLKNQKKFSNSIDNSK